MNGSLACEVAVQNLVADGRRLSLPGDPTVDPTDIAFVKSVVSFLLVAGTGMGAFWLWLRTRATTPSDMERTVEDLRHENAQFQADIASRMAELEERVDFAERQLIQERQLSRLPEPPRTRTPVWGLAAVFTSWRWVPRREIR